MSPKSGQKGQPGSSVLSTHFHYDQDRNLWTPTSASKDFGYSDGDAHEDYLLSTIKGASDRTVLSPELTAGMKDWPSTYHLHHQRANIFRAVADHLAGPVLEIGAGTGILSRYIGEEGHDLYALEGSTRRATITAERCRDLENVDVVNANFRDFRPDIKFKTITLIGVLEYARLYFSDDSDGDPVEAMLKAVESLLAPDGILIVAIENQLGLKYFAGYPEDHFGVTFYGIEDRYTDDSIVTFGRSELESKIAGSGLSNVAFAYPFPDYKFPQTVLFERAMHEPFAEKLAGLVAGAVKADKQKPTRQLLSMSGAIQPVMRNGLGAEFANSFLILASRPDHAVPLAADQLAVYYGNGDRKNAYLKEMTISDGPDGPKVTRRFLSDTPQDRDLDFYMEMEDETLVSGTLWTDVLQKQLLDPHWRVDDIVQWTQVWISALRAAVGDGLSEPPGKTDMIPGHFLDAIPKNLVVSNDREPVFIDLEWRSKSPIGFDFLLLRGLSDTLRGLEFVGHSGQPLEALTIIQAVAHGIGIAFSRAELEALLQREAKFVGQIMRRRVDYSRPYHLPARITEKELGKMARRRRKWLARKFRAKAFLARLRSK